MFIRYAEKEVVTSFHDGRIDHVLEYDNQTLKVTYCKFFVCFVCLFVCLVGVLRRINPCGPLASDGINLNMMWMEKVKICMIK